MEEKTTIRCDTCNEEVDACLDGSDSPGEFLGDSTWDAEGRGRSFICQGCFDVVMGEGNTLTLFDDKNKKYFIPFYYGIAADFGEYTSDFESVNNGESGTFDALSVIEQIIREEKTRRHFGQFARGGAWVEVMNGWHSSMEDSDQAAALREIALGKLNIPVALVFWRTSNICSVGISVYTMRKHVETVRTHLDGKRAQPGYAGVKSVKVYNAGRA